MTLKWALLGTLAALALAIIMLQQDVEALAVPFAGAAGWLANEAWQAFRGRRWT